MGGEFVDGHRLDPHQVVEGKGAISVGPNALIQVAALGDVAGVDVGADDKVEVAAAADGGDDCGCGGLVNIGLVAAEYQLVNMVVIASTLVYLGLEVSEGSNIGEVAAQQVVNPSRRRQTCGLLFG
jgi:hypothetical protein